MAAADRYTFDPVVEAGIVTAPAYRPAIEDVGGARFNDDQENPPPRDGIKYPYDSMLNQWQRQIAGAARMLPSASITIAFSGGAPFIANLETMSDVLVAGDFALTDDGDGNTLITWVSGKLPPVSRVPSVALDAGALSTALTMRVTQPTSTSVRVRTFSDNVASNIRFTLDIK